MSLPTYSEIRPYVEEGYVTERSHPENDNIKIFNYTQECQFEKKWDNVTMHCRGLIMNIETGLVLARPFPKFFNVDEHFHLGLQIPDEIPSVSEKMDGSLGILYYLKGIPYISTRGSFESDQAKWATKYFREHYADDAEFATETIGWTYLFEIIYPENRIVLSYDYSGLVLLAAHSTESEREELHESHRLFPVTKRYNYESLSKLKKHNRDNEEGYVLHYPSNNLRVKIKFDDYVRLHKIVTGLSERGIWELLVEHGVDINTRELLQDVPDEFHTWMDNVLERLKDEYSRIEEIAMNEYEEIVVSFPLSRKEWADKITKTTYPAILFMMLDSKDYKSTIFKMIKPRGSTLFKEVI